MMKKMAKMQKQSPVLFFLVGMLMGAVVVSLVFLYKVYSTEMEASVLRNTLSTTRYTPITTTSVSTIPLNTLDPVAWPDPKPW